jgi:phage virion morphogenesis protein
MPLTIQADYSPLAAYLARLQQKSGDLLPVMDAIGQEMESRVRRRFETESDPTGAVWEEWALATVADYPEKGNGKVLDRYGNMLRSLSHQANASSVEIGFGQPYAAYHEWGTKKMPRRGMLSADPDAGTLAPDDVTAILGIVNGYLEGG